MREVTTTVYQFNELPTEAAKEKAREWLRGCEQQDFDPCYEQYETAANLLGIELGETGRKQYGTVSVPDIRWSGFYSQGDGASFVGTYTFKPGCAKAIRDEFPTDTTLHKIADNLSVLFAARKLLGKSGITAKVNQDGRYYHKYTMSLEWTEDDEGGSDTIDAEEEKKLLEAMRDFAQWIYDGLEAEWDYRLSDEALNETMEANEYEFDEDGDRV